MLYKMSISVTPDMTCVVLNTININRSTDNISCIGMNRDYDAEQQ